MDMFIGTVDPQMINTRAIAKYRNAVPHIKTLPFLATGLCLALAHLDYKLHILFKMHLHYK
jgi:hypothetical protein